MWMLGVVAGIVAVDGCIKTYMEQQGKKANKSYGKVSIRYCQNKGAMYSLGKSRPDLVKNASLVIIGGVVWKWISSIFGKKNVVKSAGYSLLLGGSISNFWDRWKRNYVVDFIHVNVRFLKKIIFNVSDVFIVFGVILVALSEVLGKKK